jgi:hypothetical protein
MKSKRSNIDSILAFILIKKLVSNITTWEAYKLKLIDAQGKILKLPETDHEKESFSFLDQVVIKIKNLLGSRITSLNSFIYTQTMSQSVNSLYNNLIVLGTPNMRAELKVLGNTLKRINESTTIENLVYCLLENEILEEFEKNGKSSF